MSPMLFSTPAGTPLLTLHDSRRLMLACHLLLLDGVARRMEEWCEKTPPRMFANWATHCAPAELRRQIGNAITLAVPAELNRQWFAMLYQRPLFFTEENGMGGRIARMVQLPELAFLVSDTGPPLEVLLTQTGFPHVILAGWFLGLHHPLFDQHKDLHPVWAAFYLGQWLEWRRRQRWFAEMLPEIEARQLPYPIHVFDEKFPFPQADGYQPELIAHFCQKQDSDMEFHTLPAQVEFSPDWFKRSLHPQSVYQKFRLHYRPPEVARRFHEYPEIEWRFQLLVEQRAVMMYLAPLRQWFSLLGTNKLLRQLLSPAAAVTWLETLTSASGITSVPSPSSAG